MTPMLKAPEATCLKLKYHDLLSNCAFDSNVRRYSMALLAAEEASADWVLALMLPKAVIAELKFGSRHCAAQFKEASVLFIEISDFAALSATLAAGELVELLNFVFSTFDDALEAFGSAVYKVETVGPVYVVSAGGGPRNDARRVIRHVSKPWFIELPMTWRATST